MLLVKLAQRALKHTRFAFGNPAVAPEDSKENDEAGDIEGGDEGVEEELENKEMVDEEIGDVERPKQGGNVEDDEEEYFVVNPQQQRQQHNGIQYQPRRLAEGVRASKHKTQIARQRGYEGVADSF
eukprot:TRINITY_DN135879_c0_g1_i1.p14 TRINITY_DN135879_c0_g1~~TRINITY_DN135879_c0_g1_i1.p14  ORF type:complete len:126 (+),score=19.34 TRINITY_DN135879_c0_g1_i1:1292-1669(+)